MCIRHTLNDIHDILHGSRRIQMQGSCAAQQAHAVDQPRQTKIMIAMQMADENMLHIAPFEAIALHLYLGAFAAVQQNMLAVYRDYLCMWDVFQMPVSAELFPSMVTFIYLSF